MAGVIDSLPMEEIAALCRRVHVAELSIFGPALHDDFHPDSDLDFLVRFEPDARPSLFTHLDLQERLAEVLGRRVDLGSRRGLERSQHAVRRTANLSTAGPLYVAG